MYVAKWQFSGSRIMFFIVKSILSNYNFSAEELLIFIFWRWHLCSPTPDPFLARHLILIKKGGLLQLKFGAVVVGVGVNIYLWAW